MAIFGQYTGARVSSLPSGFLGAAMQSAANTQRGLERAGQTIGDALATYGKRKEESEMLDGMIQGQAQRALEINQFLGGGKDGEVSGNIGPDGQAVTGNPDKQTMTGALPGAANVTEQNIPQPVMAEFGIESASPLSQKTNLLYEIAGDQKLVDKFLSGDATLAQKKGLLANLQMYNTKLDDFTKRAAIDEYKFKKSQRDAYNRSFGAGAEDVVVAPATVEQDSVTREIASKSRLDAILHKQETGQTLTPSEFDELESYFASGGEFRPGKARESGPLPTLSSVPLRLPDNEAKSNMPDFSAYSGDLNKERQILAASKDGLSAIQNQLYEASAKKAEIDTKIQIARNTPGKKVSPDLIAQSGNLEKQIQAYANSAQSAQQDIAGRENYLSYVDDQGRKMGEKALSAFRSEVPKIAEQGVAGYLAGQLMPKDVVTDTVRGGGIVRPGIPAMPEGGYVDKPWTETEVTTREVPAVTRPASNAENKAARIKSFMDAGGTMTPEVMAQFDKEYPESEIVSRPVPGVAGATALFDSKGRFLQVVTPPTLSASERAAVNAVTFTPNTGFTGVAPSKEEAVKFRELIATSNEVTVMMDQLMKMAKESKVKAWGPDKAKAKAMIATLVGKMRIPLTGGGPLTLEERKYIQENLFTDPYDWKTWSETSESQIQTVMDMMANSVNRKAEVLGLQPAGQSPAGSSAPQMRSFDVTGNEVK